MKRTMGWVLRAGVLLLAAMASGCASFQGGNLDAVEAYPQVARKQTIHARLAFSGKLNGEPWTRNDARNEAYLERRCMEILETSGMFSLVTDDLATTDLHLYVALIDEKRSSAAWQTLSSLTLCLLPYRATDTFRLAAVLKDTTTGEERQIALQESVNHRQHLFLLPFAPFRTAGGELEECSDRLFENLCLEIHRTGLLE